MNILMRRLDENVHHLRREIDLCKRFIKETKWWEFKLRKSYRKEIRTLKKTIIKLESAKEKYRYDDK